MEIKHGIKGEIVFNGDWPENAAEARLIAASNFTPDTSGSLGQFVFSDPIKVGVDKLQYQLSLEPARYEIIAVIFREQGVSWDISNILAVHEPESSCSIFPDTSQAIEIDTENTVVDSVDIEVDLTKGSIAGKVDFAGDWPSEISFAAVLAFEFPFSLVPCGIAILPVNVKSAEYRMFVPENTYALTVVAGNSLSITEITIIGAYTESDSEASAPVQIGQNETIQNINITADLTLLPN